ncbi:MAG: efflux RND transporter periplasmic adaptor subunit [Lysobacteraceae bacterium]
MSDTSELLKALKIDRQAAPPAARRRWPWIVALAVLVTLGVAALLLLRPSPLTVRTVAASAIEAGQASARASVLDASGYVTARRQATVSAKITGKVEEILIEEGQAVAEGELLARLDPTDARAQHQLAQAQQAAARAQVAQVEAQLGLARSTWQRQRELRQRQLTSQAALDQAEAELETLKAQLAAVRRNVEVANASLALADIGIDNTLIRAPFSGVITVKAAQPGEIVSPISGGGGFTRTGIGTVVDMDSLEIQVDVNESFIGRVQPEQRVDAVLNAWPDWRIPARVIAIVPAADRSKATVKVRIGLLEKDARIVPDMGVRVSFLADEPSVQAAASQPSGVAVPAEAVLIRDGESIVFVVREARARLRVVDADEARGGQRRITRGLALGERVVLSPPPQLADNAPVDEQPQ